MDIRVSRGRGLALAVLVVFFAAAAPLAAATRTWTGLGADTNWMTAGNWDVLPAAGDDLVFPTGVPAPSLTNNNNFPAATSFHSITFTGGNYTIGGNAIQLVAGTSNQAGINQINFGVTLAASQMFASTAGQLTFTTIDLGANTLTFDDSGGDSEVIGVISGTGGIIKNGASDTVRFDGNNTYTGPSVCNAGTLDIIGSQPSSAITVNGGTLLGVGTTGPVTMAGGAITPGTTFVSGGVFNINGLTFTSSAATDSVQIYGTTPSLSGYDQLNVTGAVSLGNATLAVSVGGSFTPTIGDVFTIINNDGADAVTGTFNGLPEASVFAASGFNFRVSYVGGTGNDVTLTAVAATPTPTPTPTTAPVQVPTLSFSMLGLLALALVAAAFVLMRR